MKLLRTISLLSVLLLMTGCIKEDMSDCPSLLNTELTFSYTGDTNDSTMFVQMIDRVKLYVFDTDGQFVASYDIDKTALSEFQGFRMLLEEGEYKIVCWGNAASDTEISASSLTSGTVSHPNFLLGTDIPTNDHLYMGEYNITVPATGNVSGNVPFTSKHVNFQIYIDGLGVAGNTDTYPIVEVGNLMPQYDLLGNNIQPYETTYLPYVGYDTYKNVNASIFQVLDFNDDNTIQIVIKDRDGNIRCSFDLKQYMMDNSISIDSLQERTISILVTFSDLGVTIKVPNWVINPINPFS